MPESVHGHTLDCLLVPSDVTDFVHAMPKAELHVHLVGSASVPTVVELARRHPERGVPTDPDALAAFYEFRDFTHFIEVYQKVSALVTTPEDVTALVTGLGRDLAASNVRYAEVTVTPYSHLLAGIEPAAVAQALTEGRRRVAADRGIELAWIFDIPGEYGVPSGRDTLAWVERHAPEGTVGFGLGGPEVGVERAQFADVFAAARAAGLHCIPHAGETTGPETVWSALRDLGAERIGHGVGSADDPRLVEYLAAERIPLEMCPTSNVCTGAVARIEDHPLPRLLRAGVPVTLNTDDPGMFATDLNREYDVALDVLGLTLTELRTLAGNAIDAAFCSTETKAKLRAAAAHT
ncbi:MAG: adenosine deaminase [Streptosporangiales bacterium]|nr:adenosine deaminase [Streptosporangiales bacterium]MBO0892349.1 adenosine deaminase [Acidothermales bacterium]